MKYILFIILIVTPLSFLSAHTTGASHEAVVDGYLIDIGYDPVEITAGTSGRLDFALFKEGTEEEVRFSDVWLRIVKDNDTLFAGGIHRADIGRTGVLYVFPEAGTYTISARFENAEGSIAETSFPLSVLPSENNSSTDTRSRVIPIILTIGGLIVGVGVGRLLSKRK